MLLFPIPKFRRVIREKRRISFHLFPLLKSTPARRETETGRLIPGSHVMGQALHRRYSHSYVPSSPPPLPMLNVHTCTPTKSFINSIKHWESASSRKVLSQINQGFLHCFISVQHHSGVHAKIHGEHRAIDF